MIRFDEGNRLIRFPPESVPVLTDAFERLDGDVPVRFKWFPLCEEQLARLPLLPIFLAKGLTELPVSLVHILERDTESTAKLD